MPGLIYQRQPGLHSLGLAFLFVYFRLGFPPGGLYDVGLSPFRGFVELDFVAGCFVDLVFSCDSEGFGEGLVGFSFSFGCLASSGVSLYSGFSSTI
jgi:hypothetical protein